MKITGKIRDGRVGIKLLRPGKGTITLNISEYMWTYLTVKADSSGIFKNDVRFHKFIQLLSVSTHDTDDKQLVNELDVINEYYQVKEEII